MAPRTSHRASTSRRSRSSHRASRRSTRRSRRSSATRRRPPIRGRRPHAQAQAHLVAGRVRAVLRGPAAGDRARRHGSRRPRTPTPASRWDSRRRRRSSSGDRSKHILYYAMQMFFANGGGPCYIVSVGTLQGDGHSPGRHRAQAGADPAGQGRRADADRGPRGQALPIADFQALEPTVLDQCATLQDRFAIMDVHGDDDLDVGQQGRRSPTPLTATSATRRRHQQPEVRGGLRAQHRDGSRLRRRRGADRGRRTSRTPRQPSTAQARLPRRRTTSATNWPRPRSGTTRCSCRPAVRWPASTPRSTRARGLEGARERRR